MSMKRRMVQYLWQRFVNNASLQDQTTDHQPFGVTTRTTGARRLAARSQVTKYSVTFADA